jgi:polar amino acid transport system substrate-binding protein
VKRFGVALIFALVMAETVFAAGDTQAIGRDNSLETIINRKRFVMGLDDSFPPMGFRNERNEIVGYDVDLAREVARRLGVELVLRPIDWAAMEQKLNAGEIDCIWNGFTITEERRRNVLFTPPYMRNGEEEFGIGFRKNDIALTETVWATLLDMARDGTVARITFQWMGADISIIGR